MKERLNDPRLQNWPPVFLNGEGFELRAKFISPMRFAMVKYWLLLPLKDIWIYAFIVLVIDGLLTWPQFWTLFHYTHVERSMVYGVMVALWALWQVEQMSGYFFVRLLFGKKLRIHVSDVGVQAGCGNQMRWLPIEHGMSFAVRDLVTGEADEILRRSRAVTAIIADSSRSDLAEILSEHKAELIVSNANLILSLRGNSHRPARDIDPSRFG